jgi:hypothetical protein
MQIPTNLTVSAVGWNWNFHINGLVNAANTNSNVKISGAASANSPVTVVGTIFYPYCEITQSD